MFTSRKLVSLAQEDGTLRLSLVPQTLEAPLADEIIVRIEAAPINPTDLGLLLGPADVRSLRTTDDGLVFDIPPAVMPRIAGRLGQALPVGIEGAGTVIAAGPEAEHLIGRHVSLFGDGTYADHLRVKAADVVILPEGATPAQGAHIAVNPMTALGFVETLRAEGHTALVHTAAASNLGQILQRICLKDGIPLVNIVRSEPQAALLRSIGATHIVNSQDPDFPAQLLQAVQDTGATLAFDAISGGTLGSEILTAMEQAATARMPVFSRYGSDTHKQLYIYGRLDGSETRLNRSGFGMRWGVGGWLLMPFLASAGPEVAARMRQRVLDELHTTFVSSYTRTIGLAEALNPDILRAYERKATGEKYLINPTLG